jgi:hypothetical protein
MRRFTVALSALALTVALLAGASTASSAPLPSPKKLACPTAKEVRQAERAAKLKGKAKGAKAKGAKAKRKRARRRGTPIVVVSRTRQAVVFERRGRTFACWRPTKKVWLLGRAVPTSEIVGERIAYGAGAVVRELALPTGEPTDAAPAVDPGTPVTGATVTDVVLRGDGALAWIVEATAGDSKLRQVRQAGGLLASSSSIDLQSLALAGDRVTWTVVGIEYDAPLTLPEPDAIGDELG